MNNNKEYTKEKNKKKYILITIFIINDT